MREPDGRERRGAYNWPVQGADIVGEGAAGNTASVLLREAPAGDYTVETKLTIDLGVGTIRNYQQGGLIAYVNDDLWTRLSHVAIWNTRQTEFGKEMPFAGKTSFGGMLVGPPDTTTWLQALAPDRPGERRARVQGSHQPRRGVLDLGRNLDPAGGHDAAHRPDLTRQTGPERPVRYQQVRLLPRVPAVVDRFWERPYGLKFAVGIEDTFIPQVSPGLRSLDEYELTGHYDNWREDLDLAASSGASMIRYGIPWYRVNPGLDEWDWSWTDRVIERLHAVDLTPIIDLMHYGCPLWLEREFANPDYPRRVAEYAARFAERYAAVRFYTPMNEPLLTPRIARRRPLAASPDGRRGLRDAGEAANPGHRAHPAGRKGGGARSHLRSRRGDFPLRWRPRARRTHRPLGAPELARLRPAIRAGGW